MSWSHPAILAAVVVILVEAAIIAWLIAGRRRSKRLAETLREEEAKVKLAEKVARVGFWVGTPPGSEPPPVPREKADQNGAAACDPTDYFCRINAGDGNIVKEMMALTGNGGEVVTREHRLVLSSGEIRWLRLCMCRVPGAGGNGSKVAGASLDITARRRVEEAMQRLAHTDRLTLVGELTASIAHEINQPLGAILNNAEAAEMLLDTGRPQLDELRSILADIRRDDKRASDVIQHLRALLRRREMQMQTVSLNDIISDTLRIVTPDARRRSVRIERLCEGGPEFIRGDRVHLEQVLLNLLLNAMEAMSETEPARRRLVIRTAMAENEVAEVSVMDCGHGIPQDRLPLIFDSFFSTREDGMGIGLAIARSIVEAHGGRITAGNNVDGGATFRLFLPTAGEDN